jgi:phosphoglycolate phosphatase-like HAD superfamily hydrolase
MCVFGYGSRAELEGAGADYIVSTVEEIGKAILAK